MLSLNRDVGGAGHSISSPYRCPTLCYVKLCHNYANFTEVETLLAYTHDDGNDVVST